MNDNGNVLFEILLLSDKLLSNNLVLSNMEIAFAADNTAVKQNVAGPNIPLSILFYVETEVSFIFKESIDRFLSCCREPH